MSAPLVLLDLDGTLTDASPGIVTSLRRAFEVTRLPVPDETELRDAVGVPLREAFPKLGVPPDLFDIAAAAYRSEYEATGINDQALFAGIPDCLDALTAAELRLAIATAKPERYARPIARVLGLDAWIPDVFGAISDHARSTKSQVIGHALAVLGERDGAAVDPGRSLMVGDRRHDVAGAREHGMDAVGVRWGAAARGELESARAWAIVESPAELAILVANRLGAPA